ncbi:unnamed protein product [Cyprideis torosa]|uniref:DNA repair and recombination protein RAD54-like n=1 Tax=Cyprideis torosa TaxID=163714 RepID=A0A7R8ZLA2_9CRUS|nr:unnamed protein product [Cyprideis torosa]CAG0886182.1 unnamed protein product [Cyprideis torosa]
MFLFPLVEPSITWSLCGAIREFQLVEPFGSWNIGLLQDDSLEGLNLAVYDQRSLEEGVLAQVDKAVEAETRKKLENKKENVERRLRQAEADLAALAKPRAGLTLSYVATLRAKEKRIAQKVEDLKKTKASLEDRLNHVGDEVKDDLDEQDDAVRHGEKTPFGSSVASGATISPEVRSVAAYLERQKALMAKRKSLLAKKRKIVEGDSDSLPAALPPPRKKRRRGRPPKEKELKEERMEDGKQDGSPVSAFSLRPSSFMMLMDMDRRLKLFQRQMARNDVVPGRCIWSSSPLPMLLRRMMSFPKPTDSVACVQESYGKGDIGNPGHGFPDDAVNCLEVAAILVGYGQDGSELVHTLLDVFFGLMVDQSQFTFAESSTDEVECEIPDHVMSDAEEDGERSSSPDVRNADTGSPPLKVKIVNPKRRDLLSLSPTSGKPRIRDDGNIKDFEHRMKALEKQMKMLGHSPEADKEIEGKLRVPLSLWTKLYKYQQVGVQWLCELHQRQCGGILGDEMGLGKTIQVITLLGALHHSRKSSQHHHHHRPHLIVAPTTVVHQWVAEFHEWYPQLRVAILHETGSFHGPKSVLIHSIKQTGGVLITTYQGVVQHLELLLYKDWHYVILDEGHKIRNPEAQVTTAVKQFRTPHRLILSGSPLQNNLKELWCLFDFVFPGKLGTLPVFMEQFSIPITQGGYANASEVEVATAHKCAVMLRNAISPYLLRRMKADVQSHIELPTKNEQVLFCQLAPFQKTVYKEYLNSSQVGDVLEGRLKVFGALIHLRKICNHPDLFLSRAAPEADETDQSEAAQSFGYWRRSGKTIVVESLLKIWKKQDHRVLLFSQTKQMLNILEKLVVAEGYSFLRMDGSTAIGSRQGLINKFNSDTSIFVFLLTTRVGGLGVNLTGADRVVIFDPDWNPSTDTQARERAWRIGQEKHVTIYRLITAGTIEEKMFHRQIYKQYLTNRVLHDPRQRRFFKSNELHDLFSFVDDEERTESRDLFSGTGSRVRMSKKSVEAEAVNKKHHRHHHKHHKKHRHHHHHHQKKKSEDSSSPPASVATTEEEEKTTGCEDSGESEEKIQRMKELAKKLSAKLASAATSCNKEYGKTEDPISPRAMASVSVDESSSSNMEMGEMVRRSLTFPSPPVKSSSSSPSKRSKSGTKVDGERIAYCVRRKVFDKQREGEEDKEAAKEKHLKHDDYVLSALFRKSGVKEAFRHDAIVSGSSTLDPSLVEREAEKVAESAVSALRSSRREYLGFTLYSSAQGSSHGHSQPRFGQKKRASLSSSLSVDSAIAPAGTSSTQQQWSSERLIKAIAKAESATTGNQKLFAAGTTDSELTTQ